MYVGSRICTSWIGLYASFNTHAIYSMKWFRWGRPATWIRIQFNNPALSLQRGQQTSKKSAQNPDLWTNFSYRSFRRSSRRPCRPHVFNRQLIFGLDLRENKSEIENSGAWVLCRICPFQSLRGIFTKFIAIWEKIVVL